MATYSILNSMPFLTSKSYTMVALHCINSHCVTMPMQHKHCQLCLILRFCPISAGKGRIELFCDATVFGSGCWFIPTLPRCADEADASLKSSDARICNETVTYLRPDDTTDSMLAGIDSVSTALNVGKWNTHNKGLLMKKVMLGPKARMCSLMFSVP